MKNGGRLKTENNVFNEAYDDGNFDVNQRDKQENLIYLYFTTIGHLLIRKRSLE